MKYTSDPNSMFSFVSSFFSPSQKHKNEHLGHHKKEINCLTFVHHFEARQRIKKYCASLFLSDDWDDYMETRNRLDHPHRFKKLEMIGAIGTIRTIIWKPALKELLKAHCTVPRDANDH